MVTSDFTRLKMGINLRPSTTAAWRYCPHPVLAEMVARHRAFREAFRRVRRDVWSGREARLVAKWESYG